METRRILTTIDTHTAGGPTRILTSGVPFLPGTSLPEKFAYFKDHFDPIRKLLLTEPRGHRDMYGAVVTVTRQRGADLGVFFMTAAGYLPSCVHSAMGVAAAMLQTGALRLEPPEIEWVFETPGGLVALKPRSQAGKLASISLQTQPAYVQDVGAELRAGGRDLRVDLVFSGVFFVLVDSSPNGLELRPARLPEFIVLGQQVLAEANERFETRHPGLPEIKGFALTVFYDRIDKSHFRDIVIGRTGSVDRSPCGAGSGALAVLLSVQGELASNEGIDIEGVIGTHFGARIVRPVRVGGYSGGIPEVSGSAYVTGFHQFVLDAEDPLGEGFILG